MESQTLIMLSGINSTIEMKLAPIALFAYNRPNHLNETLRALKRNSLSGESILYIFCDGPRINATDGEISEVFRLRIKPR